MASHSESLRALVTGINGFTGHYVAEELKRHGYQLFGTAHSNKIQKDNIYKLDLCKQDEVFSLVKEVQPHVVIHLAAVSSVVHGNVDEIYQTNIVGSRNLLDSLNRLTKKPNSVLLASSANIYGNSEFEIIDEAVDPNPANDYAISKLAMEYMARTWFDKLPITIVRPFNYTGLGQKDNFLIPKIVNAFQKKEKFIELGNIFVERDFSDVRRVADAYVRMLSKNTSGQTFNICSGNCISLHKIISMMESIAGYKIEVKVNPQFVRQNEVKKLQGSACKVEKSIGPLRNIDFFDTLLWMYKGN